MTKFSVYHYDMESFYYAFSKWHSKTSFGEVVGVCDAPDMEEYKFVAVVDASNIDDVFEATNHIRSDWQENDNVQSFGQDNRSTSVGDIVINMDTLESYLCDSFGWKEIDSKKVDSDCLV